LPNPVGLVEIAGRQLRRQNVDLTLLSEEPRDALGFLVDIEF
jgi:hypothetical protein